MVPVNTHVPTFPTLGSPWVIAHHLCEAHDGVPLLPSLLIISSGLAIPEGSDYLDGEDVYHHWPPPLVPSLTDRWRGSQAGETSASVLSTAAHAGSLLSWKVRSLAGNEKTLEFWLSVCRARSPGGQEPKLKGLVGLSLPDTVTRTV